MIYLYFVLFFFLRVIVIYLYFLFFSTCDCDSSIFSVFFSLSVCLRFACFEIKMVACVFVWYRDTPVNTKAELLTYTNILTVIRPKKKYIRNLFFFKLNLTRRKKENSKFLFSFTLIYESMP